MDFIVNAKTTLSRIAHISLSAKEDAFYNETMITSIKCSTPLKENEDIAELVIPSTFTHCNKCYNVDSIGVLAFSKMKNKIVRLKIDDNIKTIFVQAFRNTNIEELIWPASCYVIPDSCFSESTIKKIKNIENVNRVDNLAFAKTKIQKINWPAKCKKIPSGCFFSCSDLVQIEIPDTITNIDKEAFWGCTSLTSFYIPPKCQNLSKNCFTNCSSLQSIIVNSNYLNIGENAFTGTQLKKIDVNNTVYLNAADNSFPPECKVNIPFYS